MFHCRTCWHLADLTNRGRADFVELNIPDGIAVVPISKSVVLSHVLALSLTRPERWPAWWWS
jgi:hypothetical protein